MVKQPPMTVTFSPQVKPNPTGWSPCGYHSSRFTHKTDKGKYSIVALWEVTNAVGPLTPRIS